VKRGSYIPRSGDITYSSAVSRRALQLFGSAVTQKEECCVRCFHHCLVFSQRFPHLIPSSSWSSSACVMCSSHAHFQLLIWPGCLQGKVSSGRSLQVQEQVSSKCY